VNSQPKCFSLVAERRQFGRRQTQLYATISASGRPLKPCVVRDLSAGSARVEVDFPAWLPSRFQLMIEATGFEADCEVMHRTNDAVGVRFAALRTTG
jgi:hypothetical protein